VPIITSKSRFLRSISSSKRISLSNGVFNLPTITKTGNSWTYNNNLTVPMSAGERVSWTVLTGIPDYYFSISRSGDHGTSIRISIFDGSGTTGALLAAYTGGSPSSFFFQSRPGQTITFVAEVNNLLSSATFNVNLIPAVSISSSIPASGEISYFRHSLGWIINGEDNLQSGQFWAREEGKSYPLRNPSAVDVQVFTANGTWIKPSNATWVRVFMVGGGQGGGRGATGTSTGTKMGGYGGRSGAVVNYFGMLASALGSTETVTVGAGGTGTPGTNLSNQVESFGGVGGTSQFGNIVKAAGGNFAVDIVGDFAPTNTGMSYLVGSHLLAQNASSGGAGASLVNTLATSGSAPQFVPVSLSEVVTFGSQGRSSGIPFPGSNTPSELVPSGSTSQSSTQLLGCDGGGGVGPGGLLPFGGSGGAGGGTKADLTYSGNGGPGGLYGGGGGGGAAALNGTTSGSGGNGGPGIVLIMAW
jgi:hypothetical protein